MHRWLTRLFMLTTLGPILLWLGCIVGVVFLANVYGCRVDEGGTYPCDMHGRDVGDTAAMLGLLAAWGPLFFGPVVVASALGWALYAIVRAAMRRRKSS